jgi:hypothetical protein
MGCDVYEGVISASSSAEAILKYQEMAPIGSYDDQAYRITKIRVFDQEFKNKADGLLFLQSHVKKWDMEAGMVKCGDSQYAYYVMLPC